MERERHPFAPSRRHLGALLASAGALALPAIPAIAATIEPDAELIAFAENVVLLSNRAERAWVAAGKRSDAAMLARPDHPMSPPVVPGTGPAREMPANQLREYIAEALTEPMMTEDDPWMVDMRARLGRMEAYEAERARLESHFRVEAAEACACRAEDRLKTAGAALATMQATSLAGVIAKAKTAVADDALYHNAEWADDLAMSTLNDLLAIGGAA